VLAAADLSSLRLASTGAGRVLPSLVHAMRERLGCPVVIRYASTELPICFGTDAGDPAEIVSTTVGRPLGGIEARIRGEDGRSLRAGTVGRIHARSRSEMRGYWRDPVRTAGAMDPDGWIATGDLRSMDGEGRLTIVGRVDDAYIRGGTTSTRPRSRTRRWPTRRSSGSRSSEPRPR
jgi:long-subunit acyl-CoA synthetase (AMP-forming)